jgi:DNA-binding transcriptional LysR family regulator
MHLVVEKGVPLEERKTMTAGLLDWDAARVLLDVVRCGNLRSAAERLSLSNQMMLFASRKYLETHGSPRSLDEMHRHRLVLQVVDEAAAKEAFDSAFPGSAQRDLAVMKTNASSANDWAVANRAGIGVFPTYALALGGQMTPLDIGLPRSFDRWLSNRASSGRPRVRQMIDWLTEAFNPARRPWFGDEFHPSTGT